MSPWLSEPWALAAALGVVAHLAADFPFQVNRIAHNKGRSSAALVAHAACVFAAFLVVLSPFIGLAYAAVFALIQAAAHVVIDVTKIWLMARAMPTDADGWSDRPSVLFMADQAAHLVVLAAAFRALTVLVPGWWSGAQVGNWTEIAFGLPAGTGNAALAVVAVITSLLITNIWLGRYLIEALVNPGGKPAKPGQPAHGAAIGVVERLLIVGLVLFGRWDGIVGVLAVKTLARFENFKSDGGRRFAEQFILGTLTSVGVAVATATIARWVITGSV